MVFVVGGLLVVLVIGYVAFPFWGIPGRRRSVSDDTRRMIADEVEQEILTYRQNYD